MRNFGQQQPQPAYHDPDLDDQWDDEQDDDGVMSDADINALFDLDDGEEDQGGVGLDGMIMPGGRSKDNDAYLEAARAQKEAAQAQHQFYNTRTEQERQAESARIAREQQAAQQAQIEARRKAHIEAINQYRPQVSAMDQAALDAISAKLDPETRRYLDAVAQKQTAELWEKSFAPLLQQAQGEVFDLRQQLNTRPQTLLGPEDRVRLAHPDIEHLETDPRWQSYLDQREGAAGLTRRAAAQMAFSAGDPLPLIALASKYKESLDTRQNKQRPQAAAHGAQVAEPRTQTRGSTRMYPYSDYLAKRDAFMSGQLSQSAYDKFFAKVSELEAQGLVDYNR